MGLTTPTGVFILIHSATIQVRHLGRRVNVLATIFRVASVFVKGVDGIVRGMLQTNWGREIG